MTRHNETGARCVNRTPVKSIRRQSESDMTNDTAHQPPADPGAGDDVPPVLVCPLCCTGHTTVEAPNWLGESGTMPAHWRFVFSVIDPLPYDGREAPPALRHEKLDAARLYALVYGDRALVRAIREARGLPRRHGQAPWDSLWDAIDRLAHKLVAA